VGTCGYAYGGDEGGGEGVVSPAGRRRDERLDD